jgi:hypothetical protein
VVESGVEAEFVKEVSAFLRPSGDPDDAAALHLRDLPDEGAHRPCCGRNDDCFAGLGLADVEEARVGRHPRHAEDAERSRHRRQGRIKLAQAGAVRDRMRLPAGHAENDVAGREPLVAGAHDFAHRAARHHLVDLDWLRIGLRRAHAAPHVGVEGKVKRPQQHLAVAWLRDRRGLEAEVIPHRLADRPRREDNPAIDFGHVISLSNEMPPCAP